MKILIVEHDSSAMVSINTVLQNSGHQTTLASNANDALRSLQANTDIKLIICDVTLPGMDGFDLLKSIKANPVYGYIPVIMCSSSTDQESVLKSFELGAKDYIAKPINEQVITAKIAKLAAREETTKILVVDDEEFILDILVRVLEREGYQVISTQSPLKALSLLESFNVGVVISDISMPEIDGIELLKRIKARYPNMPVMLISGHTAKYSKSAMIAAGAAGFITKPFRNTEIIDEIASFNIEKIVRHRTAPAGR